jgi:hypothetical protein
MTKQEKEIVEKMLKSLIDIGDRTADCARTSYCSVGANEPIRYAITDARLSLASAREAVLRANAAVELLLAIRDKEGS